MVMLKEWYTVEEAAKYLGVSRRTIYKLSKEGRLRTHILSKGRTRRFRKDDLDKVPQPLESMAEQIETVTALSAAGDPLLAELWSNEKDAAYDTI